MNAEQDNSLNVEEALGMVLKDTKSLQQEKSDTKSNKNKRAIVTSSSNANRQNLDDYQHGDYIVGDDGVVGIVIDREKKLNQLAENDPEFQMMKDLIDESDPLFSKIDPFFNNIEKGRDVVGEYLGKSENEEAKLKIQEVKAQFANFRIGGNGRLFYKDDPRVIAYQEAMRKLETGEVILPTVSEYDEMERQAKERAVKKRDQQVVIQHPSQAERETNPPVTKDNSADTSQDLEEVEIEQEEEVMSEDMRKELIASAAQDPMVVAAQTKPKEEGKKERGVTISQPQKQPIDLFKVKEELDRMTTVQEEKPAAESLPEPEEAQVVINVPEKKAEVFMQSMSPTIAKKVETAKKINVNFTGELTLPNTTRRVTSIDSYRRVAPKNVSAELVPRVLVNSGYIGYFKACGSLKWSTLSPVIDDDGNIGDMDIGKIAQFCYEQLVTTSIGPMSYRRFLEHTSVDDIESILHAILGASLPDEQDVEMVCGNRTCEKTFSSKYSISQLPDYDKMEEDTRNAVNEIMGAKDIIDDAMDTHMTFPVMRKIVYQANTESKFVFKHRDLATVVDRNPVLEHLTERYGTSTMAISNFVSELYVKTKNDGDDSDYALTTDPGVICEELYRINTTSLNEMRAVADEIPAITPISYSLKGKFTCDHCGNTTENPRQDILSLVFQVALKARYYV